MKARWVILIIVLLVFLGVVMAGFFLSIFAEMIPMAGDKVAVIYVQGALITGQIPEGYGYTSSESISEKLRTAEENPMIKAIVLRVNSPGGTPAAAQEIVSEIKKLTKPVIVSMGDIATSGAYYISAPAKKIFADPDTMTGSIGVIWVFTNKTESYENEGINYTVIKSGKYKDMGADWRGPTEEEQQYANEVVNDLFDRFVAEVAADRNMSIEKVKNLSDGRVYVGIRAKELGLVDSIGNLYDAIDDAGKIGGIIGKPQVEYVNQLLVYSPLGVDAYIRYWNESPYGRTLVMVP
jgi:protease-4